MDLEALQRELQRDKDLVGQQLARVAQDQHLSTEGRRAKMEATVSPLAQRLESRRVAALEEVAKERRALEEKLWSDPANNVVGWRDAQARVDALGDDDGAKAEEMYRKARLSGDSQLAKALYLSGFGGAADDVPEEWANARRALADHDASHGRGFRVSLDMVCSPPPQPALSGLVSG